MRGNRFFHPEPLADHSRFTLSADAARHATKVLRLRAGDPLIVFDGSGREWAATLVDERAGVAETGEGASVDRESPLAITLAQGISKGERMDVTVRKAVELGAAAIQPIAAERSVVRLGAERSEKRIAHWRAVVIAACEQCGRNVVPHVYDPLTLDDWLASAPHPVVVLDPAAGHSPAGLEDVLAAHPALSLLVGPEGGFSAAESSAARDAGCIGMRLGPRVLRTETAGVAAMAALQTLFGDYR